VVLVISINTPESTNWVWLSTDLMTLIWLN